MKIAQSIFFVLAYFVSFGQSGTISGKILTSEGNDIKSILQITINPSNQKVNTNNYGEFSFDKLAPGTYEISLTGEGYINKKTNVTLTNDEKRSIIIVAQEKVLDLYINYWRRKRHQRTSRIGLFFIGERIKKTRIHRC